MANQGITAEKSRLMRGGKRGGALITETEEVENLTFTYDAGGNVQTLIKEKVKWDGTIWRKTITFTYDPVTGFVATKTELLELVN